MQKRICLLILCLLSLVLLFSCAGKKPLPEKEVPPKATLAQQAASAWEKEHFFKSEELYSKLLVKDELSAQERLLAWKRLASSAFQNRHFDLAQEALNKWAELAPEDKTTWSWQKYYLQVLAKTRGSKAYRQYIHNLLETEKYPWKVKRQAAWSLTSIMLQQENYNQALKTQARIYKLAPDNKAQAALETKLAKRLQQISAANWPQIASQLSAQDRSHFPYALLAWEQAMRELQKGEQSWPEIWQACRKIINNAQLVNIKPLQEKLEKLEKRLGIPIRKLALLVPLSGKYKDIGWQIARGASMAQWQKVRSGERLHVRVINSASTNWQQSLQALPAEYQFIGGPLRLSVWEKVLEAKKEQKRSFFAFLSTLGAAREGVQAWRFFSSPEDQVKALVHLAGNQMDIDNFAVLYPDERYGLHMAELFWQELVHQDKQLKGLESYPPREPTKWSDIVSHFLRTEARKEYQIESIDLNSTDFNAIHEPDFKAVFIPDSLSRAQLLVPEFFYHDEDRLLFLGPELWSQAYYSGKEAEQNYFRLAVMPGSWWPDNPASELQKLRQSLKAAGLQEPNFWVALGYDFIRFVHQLGPLPADPDPEKINRKLNQTSFSSWTLAPFSWSKEGKVQQDLFLFQPRTKELVRADAQDIQEKREKIRLQHDQRFKRELMQKKKEAKAQE